MTKDISFLQRHDLSVVEMKVGAADRSSGDLENHVVGLHNIRYGRVDHSDVLCTKPSQSFHGFAPRSSFVLCVDDRRDGAHGL